MKVTSAIVAALVAVASAKPKFTMSSLDVVAGQPFDLKWTDAKGPVNIELKAGTPPNGMKTFMVLATGVTGTSYTANIPKTVPSGQYAFTVADGPTEDDTNYSGPFSLVGTGSTSSSSGSSTVASTTISRSTTSSASSSSATTMTTSTSAMSNSTSTTSSGSSSTKASTSTTSSSSPTTTGTIPNSNGAGKVQSSLALAMVGAVAYAFLN